MHRFPWSKILLTLIYLCWLVPWLGKQHVAEVFGGPAVQWTSAWIVALLVPVVVVMGLRMLVGNLERKRAFWLIFFAMLPWVVSMSFHLIGGHLISQASIMMHGYHERSPELIQNLTEMVVDEQAAEKRKFAAGQLYELYGIQSVWLNAEGDLQRYLPDRAEQQRWEEELETYITLQESTKLLDEQLVQIHWLRNLYLYAFVLINGAGLAWLCFRRPKPIEQ